MRPAGRTERNLRDMVQVAAEVQEYVTALGEENFYADRPTQLVAEALLHRLGEAVARLTLASPTFIDAHPEIEWAKIRAMRNVVAHEYGFIDYKIVWRALCISLPRDIELIRGLID